MSRTNVGLAVMTLILGFAFSVASAEEEAAQRPKGAGAGGFMFGASRLGLDELNSKLEAGGFEELADYSTVYGGCGYGVVRDKIILGGRGAGFSQEVSSDSLRAALGGGYGFFNVGYVVYSSGGLRIFPMLGIGGGGISLRIAGRDDAPDFDDLVKDPRREVNVSTGSLLLEFGVGVDYLLLLGEDETGKGGLLLGLRAGYTLSPGKAEWKMEDGDVLRGPDVGITGPYVHIVFGGGGFEK